MPLLDGRTAVITGAAQGLGYAIAQAFLAEGANVVLGDIDGAAAATAAARLSADSRTLGVECDVVSEVHVDRLLAAAKSAFGSVDIMVNNAGITRDLTMRKMRLDDFSLVIDVHLKGTWLGTRAAASVMREQGTGGSIINMSSISGKVGNPGQTNYSAAKAGIIGLTKAAAKEIGFAGVRVNALQPGIIETLMTQKLSEEVRSARLADVPLGRFGTPEEVAQVAVFLASDMSSYLTGISIEIAGGRNI
ncbi:3-oxoacyl-ACP synthase [Cryobacterium roopkundense]|uniref:3-oxoacyl-ACP synthase n=1 Tax=Cryobacterium roopkundense TaxID=1001240 RepID=A0A099J538_9MICO|nr:3-oxoacyl-ACP reductase FabG [Cryobacterium roopkundense]KGJ73456.1 3-oxoacyl-ACP synthase [Cryobacterium roopkundense]MBB5641029.1 3-oxoacyl-[acyl-carrier protein] reductase [Cryobacterium roopkundense]